MTASRQEVGSRCVSICRALVPCALPAESERLRPDPTARVVRMQIIQFWAVLVPTRATPLCVGGHTLAAGLRPRGCGIWTTTRPQRDHHPAMITAARATGVTVLATLRRRARFLIRSKALGRGEEAPSRRPAGSRRDRGISHWLPPRQPSAGRAPGIVRLHRFLGPARTVSGPRRSKTCLIGG